MISKSQISFIKSLHTKKFRKEHQLFMVEGLKSLLEFKQSSYQISQIFCLPEHFSLLSLQFANIQIFEINNEELQKISTLQAPQGVLALLKIPQNTEIEDSNFKNKFTLMLDNIQDPGNLGTIIRTADWFGIENILCSADTVEAYNPKVVQATMGSLSRLNIYYTDICEILGKANMPISYATLLHGENIYQTQFADEGILILGNEGNGISESVARMASYRISIPNFGKAESLNVAICAAICCSEIRRK